MRTHRRRKTPNGLETASDSRFSLLHAERYRCAVLGVRLLSRERGIRLAAPDALRGGGRRSLAFTSSSVASFGRRWGRR